MEFVRARKVNLASRVNVRSFRHDQDVTEVELLLGNEDAAYPARLGLHLSRKTP